jgi:hypothetical protein
MPQGGGGTDALLRYDPPSFLQSTIPNKNSAALYLIGIQSFIYMYFTDATCLEIIVMVTNLRINSFHNDYFATLYWQVGISL